LLKYLPNMPASHIAIFNDMRGPNNSITLREASAGAALGEAMMTIARGHADVIVAGSTGTRVHETRTCHSYLQDPIAKGTDELAEATRLGATPRERQYIATLTAYYNDYQHLSPQARAKTYEERMANVASSNPTDSEAQVFYALALVSTTGGEDAKTEKMTQARTMIAPSRHTAA
jgi:hypothetical protein